jgi:hypothetical protein
VQVSYSSKTHVQHDEMLLATWQGLHCLMCIPGFSNSNSWRGRYL